MVMFSTVQAANNMPLTPEQNIQNPIVDTNLYDSTQVPNANNSANGYDLRAGTDILFNNGGVFDQILTANNNESSILEGQIARYAGFSRDVNGNNQWAYTDMEIDKLTYFIIFQMLDDSQAFEDGPNPYPFIDRFNDCNHIRWYFWGMDGIEITTFNDYPEGNDALNGSQTHNRSIRRLHQSGHQEPIPQGGKPTNHNDPIEDYVFQNEWEYMQFGVRVPDQLQNNSNIFTNADLQLQYFIKGNVEENPYFYSWMEKSKSFPHFPEVQNFNGPPIEPTDYQKIEIEININNVFVVEDQDNDKNLHFFRTPRVINSQTNPDRLEIEYFEENTFQIDIDAITLTPNNEGDNLLWKENGNLMRGTTRENVVLDANTGTPLVVNLEGKSYPKFREIEGRGPFYVRLLQPANTTMWVDVNIPNNANFNISDLIGKFIVYEVDDKGNHNCFIKMPNNWNDIQNDINNLAVNYDGGSGLTFVTGVDTGTGDATTDWLAAYLDNNTNIGIGAGSNNYNTLDGIFGLTGDEAARYYWMNQDFFDSLNLQENSNYYSCLRGLTIPIRNNNPYNEGFIQDEYLNEALAYLEDYGMLAEPNVIELSVILLTYWNRPASLSNNEFDMAERLAEAINKHSIELLRETIEEAESGYLNSERNHNNISAILRVLNTGEIYRSYNPLRILWSERLAQYYNNLTSFV